MNQPNPWILLMGGGALIQVALMVGSAKVHPWARYAGMGLCIALGIICIVLALVRVFQKKPERAPYQRKKPTRIELLPEMQAKHAAPSSRGGRAGEEGGPPKDAA